MESCISSLLLTRRYPVFQLAKITSVYPLHIATISNNLSSNCRLSCRRTVIWKKYYLAHTSFGIEILVSLHEIFKHLWQPTFGLYPPCCWLLPVWFFSDRLPEQLHPKQHLRESLPVRFLYPVCWPSLIGRTPPGDLSGGVGVSRSHISLEFTTNKTGEY